MRFPCFQFVATLLFGLLTLDATAQISSLRLIGEYEIPHATTYGNTTVGGLSGIDYDTKNDLYYIICDDRSSINPVRFYEARIFISQKGIDTVTFLGVHTLLQKDGKPYPNHKTEPGITVDPESIRYSNRSKRIYWTSEGERVVNPKGNVLVHPSINVSKLTGEYAASIVVPETLNVQSTEKGARNNGALESITFSNDGSIFYSALEEPLYEDGPRADVGESKSWVRILKYQTSTGRNVSQFAYLLEPVAHVPVPASAFKVNGISEILCSDESLLVVERSFSSGKPGCTIKLFEADIHNAGDVTSTTSLRLEPPVNPAIKKLILNFDDLGIYIDNVEGITFGPDLPNGNRTLIFIADNNFESNQKTQLLLFEVLR